MGALGVIVTDPVIEVGLQFFDLATQLLTQRHLGSVDILAWVNPQASVWVQGW